MSKAAMEFENAVGLDAERIGYELPRRPKTEGGRGERKNRVVGAAGAVVVLGSGGVGVRSWDGCAVDRVRGGDMNERAEAAENCVEALRWLLDDMADAGEDCNPETSEEYGSVASARLALKMYDEAES